MGRPRYDRAAIERAFKHHSIHGGAEFTFHGYSEESDWFTISLHGEYMDLGPREAWLLANGLSAGRAIGQRAQNIAHNEARAAAARAARAEKRFRKGQRRQLSDTELVDYCAAIRRDFPDADEIIEREYAYSVEGIALGEVRWHIAWRKSVQPGVHLEAS